MCPGFWHKHHGARPAPCFHRKEDVLNYDILARLVQQRAPAKVDEVVGRIIVVDQKKKAMSKVGPPQMVQDIQIETPERGVIAIAFYDLNLRCFTGNRADGDQLVNFEPRHKDCWIKVRCTSTEEAKANLKTMPSRHKAALHYATKRGIQVLLKATRTVKVEWLVEQGQEKPKVANTGFEKKPKPLKVPGQSEPSQLPTKKEEHMPDIKDIRHKACTQYAICMASLQAKYRGAAAKKLVDMPNEEDLRGATNTVSIAVRKSINPINTSPERTRQVADAYSDHFVRIHIGLKQAFDEQVKLDKEFVAPKPSVYPIIATGRFIDTASAVVLPEQPKA